MTRIFNVSELTDAQTRAIAADIDGGAVAVFPTDTVYGIGTNAFNEAAIQRIYEAKNRPPVSALQILTGTIEQAKAVVAWNEAAEKLAAAFWPGALTIILPSSNAGRPLLRGFAGLGLRVPGNEFLVRLLGYMQTPMASTSANLHGQPVITDGAQLAGAFDGKADYILQGGVLSPVASTVVDVSDGLKIIREAAVSRAQLERVLTANAKQV